MIRRELQSKNLGKVRTRFEDKTSNSPNFINVTSKQNLIKSGKNHFTYKQILNIYH